MFPEKVTLDHWPKTVRDNTRDAPHFEYEQDCLRLYMESRKFESRLEYMERKMNDTEEGEKLERMRNSWMDIWDQFDHINQQLDNLVLDSEDF